MTFKPKPGEDPIYDFKYITRVYNDHRQPPKNIEEALERVEATIQWVYDEAKKIGLDCDELRTRAEELKREHEGDILPALGYLAQFTPVYKDMKEDYLKGVLWWALTAREYCENTLKLSIMLREEGLIE